MKYNPLHALAYAIAAISELELLAHLKDIADCNWQWADESEMRLRRAVAIWTGSDEIIPTPYELGEEPCSSYLRFAHEAFE